VGRGERVWMRRSNCTSRPVHALTWSIRFDTGVVGLGDPFHRPCRADKRRMIAGDIMQGLKWDLRCLV